MKNLLKPILISLPFIFISSIQAAENAIPFDPSKPMVKEVGNGVYHYFQNFYSSLIVVGEEGVLITDPAGEQRALTLRNEITKLTDKPVTKVVYSHDHFDHSRGGQIFKDEGAEFIAQENCTELMSRDLENKVVMPSVTYQENMQISLGNQKIDLHYYGPNDGTCMSVIHMPEEKLIMATDIHLAGYVNEGYRLPAHNYVGVYRTLQKIRNELEFDKVISGHMPQSSPALFDEDFRFNESLFNAVWQGLQAGKSVDDLKASIRLPEFEHWRGYKQNLAAHVERMAYSIWHGN